MLENIQKYTPEQAGPRETIPPEKMVNLASQILDEQLQKNNKLSKFYLRFFGGSVTIAAASLISEASLCVAKMCGVETDPLITKNLSFIASQSCFLGAFSAIIHNIIEVDIKKLKNESNIED
jgi:hypothetical protein